MAKIVDGLAHLVPTKFFIGCNLGHYKISLAEGHAFPVNLLICVEN
ncbi:hypothetical protein MED193_15412 [Roseobacter sp. MED193]|nr:hypothetical protein MED193_15412 [Roseobacter sp. MED193]